MCIKLLPLLTILLFSLLMTSCQTNFDLSGPIDSSTPKGKVMVLKRQIKKLENSLYNTAKNGHFFNVKTYLQQMIDRIEKVKTHVDKKFHAELDEVVGLYAKAIKDYKKTKSYLLVENKFKSGKKRLRKSYKRIMLEFDKKSSDKVEKQTGEKIETKTETKTEVKNDKK